MKTLYKIITAAAVSAAAGFGIGYKIGDSHGYGRAPIDMDPADYLSRRFEIRREIAEESMPKTRAELLDWYMRINQDISHKDSGAKK